MPSALGSRVDSPPSAQRILTVLLVEDDEPTRDLYLASLMTAGYRVRSVADGLDALRSVEADGPPDLVILDLMLPRVGGLDVAYELRSQPETRDVPILVVTGTNISIPDRSICQQVLRKPIYPESLLFAIDACLKRAGPRRNQ
jgi:CheY-like chemotaxis protein